VRAAISRAAALGLLAVIGALCASSCASVIGVDKYKDAVDALCGCDQFNEMLNCKEKIKQRLEFNPDASADWIADFSDDCVCDKAIECMSRAPLCTPCDDVLLEIDRHVFLTVCTENDPQLAEQLDCYCDKCTDECQGYVICRNGDRGGGPCQECLNMHSGECPTDRIGECFPEPNTG
jgi:hypothetical protein